MSESVSFINEERTIFLVVHCLSSTNLMDEKILKTLFSASEFSDTYLHTESIAECIEQVNTLIERIEKKEAAPSEFTFAIAEIRDAQVFIHISKDKMSVKATIEAPWQGKHASIDLVKSACKKAGVKLRIKRSKIEKLLDRSFYGQAGDVFEEIIALGQEPKNGKNAYFKPLVELLSNKIRKPTEVEGGKVNLKDLGEIETVKPGEPIYEKISLTVGIDGRNVLGEKLPAVPGKDLILQATSGTMIDPNNENILLAEKEGLARIIENQMEVDDVYTVMELTPKIGHIKFKGSVVVLGDVAPDMKIVATGDVLIGGYVESASIRCKGELTVLSGVSGKPLTEPEGKRQNNCLLESGYRVNVSFVNQADIFAKRDILIHKQISHCNVRAASMVVGKGSKPNGKVIGGNYYLGKSLEAGMIGAPSNTFTNIAMNRTYDVFQNKDVQCAGKLDDLQSKIDTLNIKLSAIHQEQKINAIEQQIVKLEHSITKVTQYRKALAQRRKDYMAKVYVKANTTLYGGLQFFIASKGTLNDAEKGPSIVHLHEYTLTIEPNIH